MARRKDKPVTQAQRKPSVCSARREGDEMVCHRCGIRWSVGEDKPTSAKCD